MSFIPSRQTVFVLNFDENTFFDSPHYKEFVEANPNLKNDLDNLVRKFMEWARMPGVKTDYCFKTGDNPSGHSDFFFFHKNPNVSVDNFTSQTGTTSEKFSLTENSNLPDEALRHLANVFNKIGFKTFVGKFEPYRGFILECYTYSFTPLEKIVGTVRGYCKHDVHICVAI